MRESVLPLLRCPRCRAERTLELSQENERDEREVRSGSLTCRSCGHVLAIEHGVVDGLFDPPDYIRREAAGLERFADLMRSDGWDRERVLRLPDEPSDYWRGHRMGIDHLIETFEFEAGATLVDVGSNTCWASNVFAQQGLNVIALDIATHEMQGLRTADWWFDENGVYFERLLGDMADPPLATESADYVFCAEVLHHNKPPELRRTLRELHRVIKPGGLLFALSEPLRYPTDRKLDTGAEVAEFEGNENIYYAHEYVLAARRAGFGVELLEPRIPLFTGQPLWLTGDSSVLGSAKVFGQHLLRLSRPGRKLLLAKLMLWGPDAPLGMVCRKKG
jgi:2-polyprenyl-3-methyl-5-hydroxy-6-metoxy-1,4-benzoquinol methylase/uncharacterized protein YbaR (Trm112 family)